MASVFNPFSGLGKIASYIRWNRMRNESWNVVLRKSQKKFKGRYLTAIQSEIANTKLRELAASALRRSGPSRKIEEITLPLGKNKSKNIRITARVQNAGFKLYTLSKNSKLEITMDLPRSGTKRKLAITLREKILDAFFDHYDIANKYRQDFRRRFSDVDIVELEGI